MAAFFTNSQFDRRSFGKYLLAGAVGLGAGKAFASARPDFHILRDFQSSMKDQQMRGTCYVYSIVAALEAAYKRAGYGDLDLSEEFANDMLRTFWLEPRSTVKLPAYRNENRYNMGDHGWSDGVAHFMVESGFAIPTEKDLPYQARSPFLPTDSAFGLQYRVNSFNLDPKRFDMAALSKKTYYGIRACRDVRPNNPKAIEDALLQGKEVIWDFGVGGNRQEWLWEYDGSQAKGGHSMLIYGFDKSDAERPYFFVKNSWENQQKICISYEYPRRYGHGATIITEVATPRSWNELAYLGRWSLEIDGRQGILDLYHLPGMSKSVFDIHDLKDSATGKIMEDRRLGTFYLDGEQRKAYRVNGSVGRDGLKLNIDWAGPAQSYSSTDGREFTVRFHGNNLERMTGDLLRGDEKDGTLAAKRLHGAEHYEV